MLRTTVAGALTMRYPGTVNVYLCDDGERETVRALAEDFGVGYLTRTEHSHAKAGNLNNAMALSSGELIVTLDADMVPTAEFLERTVGHFADPTMAFVQAPQAFSNDDPFQYNLFSAAALPNEQDFFMRTLLAGKARFNAVMYVGSNTVFRRTALDEIGGFATGVITEDMATGMLLQSHGWRAEFVPDIVAAGAAPESFEDLLVQRDRWGRLAGESSWVSADDSGVTFGFSFAPMPPQQFVPLVGTITASPFWVRGDREERSGLGGALGRTVVANARRSSIAARAEVRHFTRAKAQIVPMSELRSPAAEPVSVRVEDLSFAGCRVRSGVRFEPGDLVEVQIPGVLGEPVAGEIRWVTGRNAPFRLGIKLSRQDAAVEG
jgi:hypothetical protein